MRLEVSDAVRPIYGSLGVKRLTGGVSFEVVPSSSCTPKPGGAAADGNIYGTRLAEYPSVLSRFREHPRCPETFVPSRRTSVLEKARSHVCQVQSSSRFCVSILLVREHSLSWGFVIGVEPIVGPKLRLLSVHSLTQLWPCLLRA